MDNKKKLLNFQLYSTIFAIVLGTILHFTYSWSENNTIIGLFSAVNESTWEHLKLIFFPMLISGIIGYFIFKENFPSFICSKTLGIIISILFIIISFFTYSGIIGTNYAFINILLFIISIIIGEYITYKLTINNLPCINFHSILILLTLVFLFISFTFNPPKINIFKDPIDNSYGINKRRLP